MDGLIIKEKWINLILDGLKTWEIRGSKTSKRGRIYLIQSGTKCIVGEAELVDCIKLDQDSYFDNKDKHQIDVFPSRDMNTLPYLGHTYAWVLKNSKRYDKIIPYNHPKGAIIWVKNPFEEKSGQIN